MTKVTFFTTETLDEKPSYATVPCEGTEPRRIRYTSFMSNIMEQIAKLEARLSALKEEMESPGVDAILDGLLILSANLEKNGEPIDELLDVVNAFADHFDTDDDGRNRVRTTLAPTHIIALFREEARKRLAGLSISMMGIFYADSALVSIEQSAAHLHAVKGASAMIGFPDINALSTTMERVVVSLRPLTDDQRGAALKPLLRSYSVLESLVESVDDSGPSDVPLDVVMNDLKRLLGETIEQNPFENSPQTGVQKTHTQRILVVDDEQTVAAMVGLVLADLETEIDVAEDGTSAWKMLEEKPYSLVISDVSMPGLDGVTLMDRILTDENTADIPVILLTSHEQLAPEGAADFIIKGSIGSGELRSRVAEILRQAPVVPAMETDERTILIVEDVDTIAASIAFVLSDGPYHITIAFDGRDGWERVQKNNFDLIISDWRMPRMDGLDLLRKIRNDDNHVDQKFIMLTATDSNELRQQAMALRVNDFLIKGDVGGDALLTKVREVLGS